MDSRANGRCLMNRMKWEAGDRLSPLHAASCWADGIKGIDPLVTGLIAGPMTELVERLAAEEIDLRAFWEGLIAFSAAGYASGNHLSDEEACQRALLSAGAGRLTVDNLASAAASRFSEVRLAFQEAFPKLPQQLVLRGGPLRDAWLGFGPGLLRLIGKQTHESFIPKSTTAILLSPYAGGGGSCSPASQTLWIEAVLTNPFPELPEILRLAWLVSRIGLARGLSSESAIACEDRTSPSNRGVDIGELALVPIVLQAGAELDLLPIPADDPKTIERAAGVWCGRMDPLVLEILSDWWRQNQRLRPPFPIAMKALDRMLSGPVGHQPDTP